jgi:anti-sigma regulatory factor (Ser/Thr protein kinase)
MVAAEGDSAARPHDGARSTWQTAHPGGLGHGNRGYLIPTVAGYNNGGGIAVLSRSLDIATSYEAPAEARRWLDSLAPLRALGQVAFDVRLLVSELVANSVRHAGLRPTDLIGVNLDLSDSLLRVEVCDQGPGFTLPVRPEKRTAEGGRGLQILAAVASRWGLESTKPVTVWFEIDLERHAGAPIPAAPRTVHVPKLRR